MLIAFLLAASTVSIGQIACAPDKAGVNQSGSDLYICPNTNPAVYPETYGASPSASASTNLIAIQNAIYAAFGCGNGISCRTNGSGLQSQNRPLVLTGLYHINGELKLYHVSGFVIQGVNKLLSGIVQDAQNSRIFDGQSVAYGTIRDLSFSTSVPQTTPLIDIDFDGTHGADIKPQNITFHDILVNGNGVGADVGILIAKSGSGAQGDNIRCEYCYFSGFSGAGWQIGGNNTGRNVGRFYAQNAIKESIIGGDFQGNPNFGVAVYGGSIEVHGTTMENESGCGFGCQTGPDVYCEAPQDACVIDGVRSEGHLLAWSNPIIVTNSRTLFQAAQWYNGTSCLSGTTVPVNFIISGTGSGGDGAYYKVTASSSAFGGLCNTSATGGSATTVTVSGTPWTVNAFTGYRATMWSGTGAGCYGVITSNTSNTITFSGGLVSPYFQFSCIAPDATTVFVVEPNWGTQTTSGGMTWAAFNFDVIAGGLSGTPAPISTGHIQDVSAFGGKILCGGSPINMGCTLKDVVVSRADWLDSTGGTFPLDSIYGRFEADGVAVIPPGAIAGQQIAWNIPRQGYTQQKKGSMMQVGSKPICWGTGNGSTATGDVCFYPIAQPFANLPACSAITEGYQASFTDSTTATYGATITGGGTNHVHGYCNGTNWVVD